MTTEPTKSATGLRAPLAGVSALLVVSLFLGATLTAKPAIRDAGRDNAVERAAVRQLTASLAKAVRQLVGSDQHKPGLHTVALVGLGAERLAALPRPIETARRPLIPLLRATLLDLPPPANA